MITIVKLTAAHVDGIAALEQMCFSDPWSANCISSEVTNPLSDWLVAVEDSRVVGYIGAQSVQPDADIMNVAVHPDCRRQGIAGALLAQLEGILLAKGVEHLFLEVRKGNTGAIALYEGQGFAQVGCRPGYYRHPKEDALIMRKELLP